MTKPVYDTVGYWSEVKLDIIKEYAEAYTTIMAAQKAPAFRYIYIDAFAGAGLHVSRETGQFILGSPLNALNLKNPFHEYHLIGLDSKKIEELSRLTKKRKDVIIYPGDCNEILPREILPRARFEDYCRALCILDPYGLHLSWEILKTAGSMRSVEIFMNFPVMAMNRNILKRSPASIDPSQVECMNWFWGDESWRDVAYVASDQRSLFDETMLEKTTNAALEAGFRKRLRDVAGFSYVPPPMPMRNRKNSIVYYLYFASHRPAAADIVKDIFKKYSERKDA